MRNDLAVVNSDIIQRSASHATRTLLGILHRHSLTGADLQSLLPYGVARDLLLLLFEKLVCCWCRSAETNSESAHRRQSLNDGNR